MTLLEIADDCYAIDEKQVKGIVATVCEFYHLEPFEMSLTFVSRDEIQKINMQFRGKDAATDVLSFPQLEWSQALTASSAKSRADSLRLLSDHSGQADLLMLGDVLISLGIAEINAEKIGQSLDRELCFLLVHGILHLLGHDHLAENEEELMLREQRLLMNLLERESSGDLPLWHACVWRLEGSCQ